MTRAISFSKSGAVLESCGRLVLKSSYQCDVVKLAPKERMTCISSLSRQSTASVLSIHLWSDRLFEGARIQRTEIDSFRFLSYLFVIPFVLEE